MSSTVSSPAAAQKLGATGSSQQKAQAQVRMFHFASHHASRFLSTRRLHPANVARGPRATLETTPAFSRHAAGCARKRSEHCSGRSAASPRISLSRSVQKGHVFHNSFSELQPSEIGTLFLPKRMTIARTRYKLASFLSELRAL